MKKIITKLKIVIAFVGIQFFNESLHAQIGNLIWEDNFDSFNENIWTPNIGDGCDEGICGWGNAELEYYSPNNVYIEPINGELGNNALVLEAKNESAGSQVFTSGKVDSDGKLSVQYGLIEIRMKTPNLDTGLWPAAWLLGAANLPWPAKGEIDMMEMGHAAAERERQGHAGADLNSYVGANAIFATEDGGVGSIAWDVNYDQPYIATTPMNDRFVTYRLYWEPTQMRFTVVDNNVEHDLYTSPLGLDSQGVTSVFQKPFFFLLNLAVGGNFTDALTNDEVTASLPAKMYVDYVKVFEWNGYGSVEFDYDVLEAESGPFGVYTENTPVNNELSFGLDSEIYVWGGTMQDGTTSPYEGSEVITWETLNVDSWFGGGIAATFGRDMSGYVDEGLLKFNIKVPADLSFRIGITDNYTNESWVSFTANESKYGLVRNGEWSQVEIPLSDFAGLIAFQNINYMFAIASVDGAFPSSTVQIALDNIVWDDGNPLTNDIDVTGIDLSPDTSDLLVGETVQLNAMISPSNATNQSISWSTSNSSVVTVNSNGLVTALSEGTATIVVTTDDGDYTASTFITVIEDSISVNNLALNKSVLQSTTAHGGEASRAVDGNTSGIWGDNSVTHTNKGIGEWWKVDLGATENIGDIILYNRTNCCMNRLDNITITIEDDSENVIWSKTVESSSDTSLSVNAEGVRGSVIRVTQNKDAALSLAEVEVYEYYGGVSTTFPDVDKTYYIDVPVHNLRLAATGESEEAYTTSTTTIGDDVAWKFVAKGNGYWHIERAEGGSLPRLRTDNSQYADMQGIAWSGVYTYFELTEGSTAGTYFITLPHGPTNYRRLQVGNLGEVKMVSEASNDTWESFKFTEISEDDTTVETDLFIEAEAYTCLLYTSDAADD